MKTDEWKAADPTRRPSPWKHPEILGALRAEGRSKCMYCEGKSEDVSYLTVDHIRPKDSFPDLVLEWENLGPACGRCNTNKGNYWTDHDDLRLLDPYIDAVEEHIVFAGPVAVAALGSSRGENTLRQLKFAQREDLFWSRMRRLEDLDQRLRQWDSEDDVEKKQLFAEDVSDAIAPDREFSAALVAFARWRGFPA
ncbi:HNH endonuclease signature motif containing protein [Nocardioides lacusdianchii]|uniref:HNH endonuclease signature motif containing protein n=1 Tax=Nocardioides lacusdianchii TaxID=2783664 RepID=UPI001CCA1901|nr:HNH endonuclease signature motif containing protein [Nocardioides lacusdianchii]